ncbi:MAG: hypothetical protein ACRC4M_02760 [Mycoplasma sp.]
MDKKILAILTLIPIIGPILYYFLAKPSGIEGIVTLVAIIPVVNFVMAVLLILNALDVIRL